MTIIDAWGQIPTDRMAGADWLAPLLRWTGQDPAALALSPEATVAAMDAAGIDLMLLAGWSGPSGSLISNEEVAAQVDAARERFRGLATANLRRPREAVAELRASASCPGSGSCRPTTGATTRSTPCAATSACPSVPRSATRAPCAPRTPGA